MKLVIDVPDGCYKELKEARFPAQDTYRLVEFIKNGTPLKEHDMWKELEDTITEIIKNTKVKW